MTSIESAREQILQSLRPLGRESVPLTEALGRVCAEDCAALVDLPAFDNAAVDGYALRSEDTREATPGQPVALEVTGTAAAGQAASSEVLRPGTCHRIFTGAMLPAGADAVIMQEEVQGHGEGVIRVSEMIPPWDGIRPAGEDIRSGTPVLRAGQRLRAAHLGLLAALGMTHVPVHRRPRIALLTTGSELTTPGQPLLPGQVHDSNSVLLTALARADGLEITTLSKIPDSFELTMMELATLARGHDVLVTTGGVSVGDADHVRPAFAALGGAVELWRLAMKPGKPFAWGRLESTWWFGLPGNPVSAYVTWHLLVRPALRRLTGAADLLGRTERARLGEPVGNRDERRHFLRMRFAADGTLVLAGKQASHIQSGLADAEALLDVPPGTHWPAGEEVRVDRLDA